MRIQISRALALLAMLLSISTFSQTRYWVASSAANWSGDNWSSSSGGAVDGGGPPTALQSARFDANGLGNCTIDLVDPSILNLIVNGYTGTIDLNGNTVTATGTATLTTGTINDTPGTDSLVINSTGNTIFNGTTFGAIVHVSSRLISLNGSTFNAQSTFIKNGTGNVTGTGGNVFNAPVYLTHSGTNNWIFAGTNADDFNDALTVLNSGTGSILLSHTASGNTYDGNIILNSTGTNSHIYFGNNNGTSTLADGFSVSIGASGFTSGTLRFRNFTQTGTTAQNITLGGTTSLIDSYDATWGGNVSFSAPRLVTRGSTYSGTASLTKTGSTNDQSVGGNRFNGNTTLTHAGGNQFVVGNTSPDTFDLDLNIINSGTGDLYFANNSANNLVSGNLTVTNNATNARDEIYISNATGASLSVTGNVILSNSSTASDGRIYLGNLGDVSIGGNLTTTNSAPGSAGHVYIGNANGSVISITGNTTVTNSGANTTTRTYLGNNGDVIFGGNLTITNSSTATNSEVYLHSGATSINTYNGNIIVEATNASTDGIYFGNSGGSGTLAATRTITIGGSGFIASRLFLRNLTQNGATAQSLNPSGTATNMTIYDCNWGGDVTFSSARITTRGTTYSGTASLTKTGASDDPSVGGNTFTGNTILNNTGSGYFLMGNGSPDTFGGDLDITNSGTRHFYLGHNSAGNTIAGNLTITNSGSGSSDIYISNLSASTLTITGNTVITNSASGTASTIYLGNAGDITFGGNLALTNSSTATTGQIVLADDATSTAMVTGNTTLINDGSGTTQRTWLGNGGDVTFGGTLAITNNSDATNSHVFLHDDPTSVNTYNGNITIESTEANCDGIFFGNSTGSGTLAATRTITIDGGGFIANQLLLRNFTQTGATAQTLNPSGTATYMTIYDCNWGGDIIFSSARIATRGTTYSGTSSLTKTGATDDQSIGGNNFVGNAILNNTGNGYFLMGNGSPDTFGGNLDITNSGTRHFYLGYNSAGNTIAGNLTVTNSGSGSSDIYISDRNTSTLSIGGTAVITNSASGTTSTIYLGNAGDITFGGSLTLTNSSTAATGQIILANNTASTALVTGNVIANNSGSGTTNRIYLGNSGSINFSGDINLSNSNTATTGDVYIGNGSASIISIAGNTTLTNDGSGTSRRAWLGNGGDVTFGGTLAITNNSDATNSQIFIQDDATSVNTYNGNITIESTEANCDGVFFGNSTGSGTLAATRTITIGGSGFVANQLLLRNFTQVGATAQSLNPTGTSRLTIYDNNWGGNVTFSSPQIITRGTTYSGTASLEKTGATDNSSAGGNTFTGNAILTNSGSGYFLMGNGSPDTFGGDLDITNSGTRHFYLGYNSAGNTVTGNLTVTNSGSGSSDIYISDRNTSTLSIGGTAVVTNSASGTSSTIYLGNGGDITFGNNLSLINSSTATTGQIVLADDTASTAVITGNTTLINDGSGVSKRIWLGNGGDVTFGGTLAITNNSDATNSHVFLQDDPTSVNTYNGNITIESTEANCDGVFFGNSTGSGTLAATRTITIGGSGFIATQLLLRNFTQVGATAQTLNPTGTSLLTLYNNNWGGNVTFSSPQIVTRGTTYSGTASLEKTGATDNSSAGGNTFTGNAILTNSGSGYFLMGNNGNPDTFGGDLDLTNSGTRHLYLGYNSTGNTVAGNLTVSNSGSGSSDISLSNQSVSTLSIAGTAVITNSTSGTTSTVYLGNAGDITFGSSLTLINSSTATTGQIILANNSASTALVTGNVIANNSGSGTANRIYLGNSGSINFGGDVNLSNSNSATNGDIYIANGSASTITITGNTTLINDGSGNSRRTWLGNAGDITFGGTLAITNNSDATNSQVFLQDDPTSVNIYNGNITVESTEANCDGVFFGNSTGSGTLAATRTITIGGSGFVAAQLSLRNFTQVGATAQTLNPTGTSRLTLYDNNWGGNVTFSSPQIVTRGTVYSGTASLEKTGATDNSSAGGNTFTGNAILTNSGSGYFLMGNNGNPDTFAANLDLICTGSDHLYLAYNSAGNTVAGNFTVTNSGTGSSHIFLSDQSASTLSVNGNSTITNSSSGTSNNIYIGNAGDITFNNNLNITNASSSTSGTIYLADDASSSVSVAGNTTANNSSSGVTNRLYLGNAGSANFGGNLTLSNSNTATTGELSVANGSASTVSITGNTSLINAGSGTTNRSYLGNFGDVSFGGTLAITNSSTANNSQVYCNHGSTSSNTYTGNITLENTSASSDGILFGNNTGNGTLAATRTISIGGGGFIAGNLTLRNFTQIGTTAQTLHPTGTTSMFIDDSNWGGNVDFSSPRLDAEGSTFSGTATLEKTGNGDDRSSGGNTFVGNATITNSGSGYWRFGEGTSDTFNANLDLINSGADILYFAYSGAGHLVSGNLSATNSGTGASYLYIGNNSNSSLTVNGTATIINSGSGLNVRTYVGNAGDITFNNDVALTNSASGNQGIIYLANGTNSSVSIAGNTTVTNSGTGTTKHTLLGNQGDVTFNGSLTISNSSTATNSQVYCNYEDNSDNVYNGNIILESTSASNDGVLFGNSGGEGILAATRTISIGGGGFIGSTLYFRYFTQTGATAQTLAPTGITTFTIRDCNWGGDVTFSSARITSRTSTYSSNATLEKNGASNDNSYGGNTFNGDATFTHSGTGRWRLSSSVGDDFNSNVSYIKTGSGTFEPARQGTSTFAGNINFNFNSTVTLAVGNGTVEMDGNTAQSINDLASSIEPRFRRLTLNNVNDEITLNTPISISTIMTFTQGNIITTDANLLTVRDEAIVSGASDDSYVRGPIEKIGEDDFTFPVGDSGYYRPMIISGGTGKGNSTAFRGSYFNINPDSSMYTRSSLSGGLDHVSANEYWILDLINGSPTTNVTLSWGDNSGVVDNLSELRVAKWNSVSSQWEDQGNGGNTGNTMAGTIINSTPISSFSPFTLSSTTPNNPLPIELISFDAEIFNQQVKLKWETSSEINNDYFTIERSQDGKNFEFLTTVRGAGNSNKTNTYNTYDINPLSGISYYKLTQTDFDGTKVEKGVVSVSFNKSISPSFKVYPNPVTDQHVSVEWNSVKVSNCLVALYDLEGRRLFDKTIKSVEGINQWKLPLNSISAGSYFLTIFEDGQLREKQVLIVK